MAATTLKLSRTQRRARRRNVQLAFGALLALGCGALGGMYGREYFLGARMRAENDNLERRIHAYHIKRQQSERDLAALKTPAGIERAARKLGWTRKGEVRLRIAGQ